MQNCQQGKKAEAGMGKAAGCRQLWGDGRQAGEDVIRRRNKRGKYYLFLTLLEVLKPFHTSKGLLKASKGCH